MMSKRELPFKLFLLALPQATDRLQFSPLPGPCWFIKPPLIAKLLYVNEVLKFKPQNCNENCISLAY
jgi:hypothetical protein